MYNRLAVYVNTLSGPWLGQTEGQVLCVRNPATLDQSHLLTGQIDATELSMSSHLFYQGLC